MCDRAVPTDVRHRRQRPAIHSDTMRTTPRMCIRLLVPGCPVSAFRKEIWSQLKALIRLAQYHSQLASNIFRSPSRCLPVKNVLGQPPQEYSSKNHTTPNTNHKKTKWKQIGNSRWVAATPSPKPPYDVASKSQGISTHTGHSQEAARRDDPDSTQTGAAVVQHEETITREQPVPATCSEIHEKRQNAVPRLLGPIEPALPTQASLAGVPLPHLAAPTDHARCIETPAEKGNIGEDRSENDSSSINETLFDSSPMVFPAGVFHPMYGFQRKRTMTMKAATIMQLRKALCPYGNSVPLQTYGKCSISRP